jgi:uncharacterized protein YheU (UPF0270 family)
LPCSSIIEEYISRESADYDAIEASREVSIKQVKHKLEEGLAVIIYDDETETTNILLHDNPIPKKISISV